MPRLAAMCERNIRLATEKAIADRLGVDPKLPYKFGSNFNIMFYTFQPVVRLSPETDEWVIVLTRWGLVPFWARDARDGVKRINVRAESIVTTASFRETTKIRRGLVPADAFYEWQKIGAKSKQAFAIAMLHGVSTALLASGKVGRKRMDAAGDVHHHRD